MMETQATMMDVHQPDKWNQATIDLKTLSVSLIDLSPAETLNTKAAMMKSEMMEMVVAASVR